MRKYLTDYNIRVDEVIICKSINYFEFEFLRASINHQLETSGDSDSSLYQYLKTQYTGICREKMILAFILNYFKSIENIDSYIQDAFMFTRVPYFKNLVSEFKNYLIKGARAYNFSLADRNGKVVSLADFIGKVVAIDFWFTGCTGCASFYESSLSKAELHYKNNPDVVFISISTDKDMKSWLEKGIESYKYTSESAVNLYTMGKGTEHDVIKKYKVNYFPRFVVIDRYGMIFQSDFENKNNSSELILHIQNALNSNDVSLKSEY